MLSEIPSPIKERKHFFQKPFLDPQVSLGITGEHTLSITLTHINSPSYIELLQITSCYAVIISPCN